MDFSKIANANELNILMVLGKDNQSQEIESGFLEEDPLGKRKNPNTVEKEVFMPAFGECGCSKGQHNRKRKSKK